MRLLDYIRGLRKGKEAHRLEKEAMKDSFLADAMDGYQQVEGKHEERIKELQIQITSRSTKKGNSYAITWSVAACLIIGIGVSTYFLFLRKNMIGDTFIAKETIITTTTPKIYEEEVISSPSGTKMKQDSNNILITDKEDIIAKSKVIAKRQNAPVGSVTPTVKKIIEPTIVEEETIASFTIDTTIPFLAESKFKENKLIDSTNNIIRGKVTDKNGDPLIGVNVTTYGQTGNERQTITDINGKFSLKKEKDDDEIIFSYIGFDRLQIPIDTTQTMLIAMNESPNSALNEVVVSGTGTQKKITMTGAITTVNVEKLKKHPSISNTLAGNISKEALDSLIKYTSTSAESRRKVSIKVSSPNALAGSVAGVIKKGSKKSSKQITPKPVTGMKQYQEYLKKNLIQPKDETGRKIKGIVTLTFSVNKKGRPFEIKIEKGFCESADKEAIRLIQEGPDWTYGNKPVEITVKFR